MLLCNCLSEACSCWIWFWHDSKVSSSFPLHSLLISNWSCANENWLQVIFHVTIGSLLTWSWLISSSWSQATNTAGFSLVFKEWISNSSSLIASSCCSRSASSWSLMQAIYWKSIIVHFIIGIGGFFLHSDYSLVNGIHLWLALGNVIWISITAQLVVILWYYFNLYEISRMLWRFIQIYWFQILFINYSSLQRILCNLWRAFWILFKSILDQSFMRPFFKISPQTYCNNLKFYTHNSTQKFNTIESSKSLRFIGSIYILNHIWDSTFRMNQIYAKVLFCMIINLTIYSIQNLEIGHIFTSVSKLTSFLCFSSSWFFSLWFISSAFKMASFIASISWDWLTCSFLETSSCIFKLWFSWTDC